MGSVSFSDMYCQCFIVQVITEDFTKRIFLEIFNEFDTPSNFAGILVVNNIKTFLKFSSEISLAKVVESFGYTGKLRMDVSREDKKVLKEIPTVNEKIKNLPYFQGTIYVD